MVYKTKIIEMILRTLIFYTVLVLWTLLVGFLCLPVLILPSYFTRFVGLMWIKGVFLFLRYICKITHEIRGSENIPNEPVIIVSKHQSAFETFALYFYFKNSFFIHKKQLFLIPIFGQYLMKSNMISIDRKGGAKTMRKILKEVKKKLDGGSSIIIFPEGTRKKPGEPADYKSGFVGIYKEVSRELLPIALNSGLFWPKHSLLLRKGNIVIDIQPTIPIKLNKNEVLEKVKNSIESATNKLIY